MSTDFSHDGPCQRGRRYRTRLAFKALRDSFKEGEELIFDSSAYSRYDGYTGYFFRQDGRKGLRLWDIPDDVSVNSAWKVHFEEISEGGDAGQAALA